MPSRKLRSRIALAALCAVLTPHAALEAEAQSRAPKASPPRKAASAAAAAPLDLSATPLRAQAGAADLDLAIPADPAPLMRGPTRAPRERAPKAYPPKRPPPFSPKNPLPPLEPYRTSYQAKRALSYQAKASLGLRPTTQPALADPPPVTVAVEPTIRVKPRPKVEQNPYDPLGAQLGSTLVFPYVQANGGYDDNPNRLAPDFNPRPSAFFRGEGGVRIKSDWARHNLEGELRGGYSEYFDYQNASRPDATGAMTARYDVTRDTALDLRGRMTLDTTRPGAPSISSGVQNVYVVNRPTIFGVGTQAGVTQKFGRAELSLRGTFDRVWYENAKYSDGSTLDLARTSYSGYGALLRAAYEATPDLKPFVEGTIDTRVHDSPADFNGFYRDSDGYILRAGADINLTELVKGEISGGYGERDYADARLPRLRGPVIDAALIYTPSALTTLTLRGATAMNETTLANAAGALTRSFTATLSHDLLRNLNVTLTGSYFANDYQGANVRERGANLGVKLDYKLTRSISLRGGYMHELLDSSFPNADYTANVFSLGMRLQL